ncbi:MAG: GTP pyrophosphokinase, partial [Duncaniella sp.]|nr:GTP pyrophosphokinase [Duncaniella sp.]
KIFDEFLAENDITLNNNVLTKIFGTYHVSSREELFLKLGQGEISIDDYLNANTSNTAKTLLSKIFRLGLGTGKKKEQEAETETKAAQQKQAINTKNTYILKFSDKESNFVFADCCRPIPGDEVMGFINDKGEVEVHELTCPRAQVLKASYGPRIVATRWDEVSGSFPASIVIEGIDRHGILQELTRLISTALNIDIRRLNIEAHNEVFTCDLGVMVSNTDAVDQLCRNMLKINGVKKARRIK